MKFSILLSIALCSASLPACAQPSRSLLESDPFARELHRKVFDYFWQTADSKTGLTPDRWPTLTFCSIAAEGFALTAYGIGAERGYVTREAAADRVRTVLRKYWHLPQGPAVAGKAGYRGFFYHFLGLKTGQRFKEVELSTVDTSLLLGGILFCQSYFDRDTEVEREIRALADSLYRHVEWNWAQQPSGRISHGWTPEDGMIPLEWTGYCEAMIVYILALGSPTYPAADSSWNAWTEGYVWGTFNGQECVSFPPLFGHHYSHCWIDFRGIRDAYMRGRGIDYAENSRRATYGQRAYGAANPAGWRDYSDSIWGWSACDGPGDTSFTAEGRNRRFISYGARGIAFDFVCDDGTIAPTAAGGSIMFAPEICLPALKAMKGKYGDRLYKEYGFVDSFNPSFRTPGTPDGWFDRDYLGIDQGPILLALENADSELVWKTMRKNPYIRRGLERAGFTGGWLEGKQ